MVTTYLSADEIKEQVQERGTPEQIKRMGEMLSAPAMEWHLTGIATGTYLSVPVERIAIRMETRANGGMMGLIMPDGSFMRPKTGRKTIDASDYLWQL